MRREFKSKTKVLLIDDNYDHLAGVSELVSSEGMFNVVGTSTNATMGMSLIKISSRCSYHGYEYARKKWFGSNSRN